MLPKRIKSVMIHICLKDGQIWVEEDWPEEGVAFPILESFRAIKPIATIAIALFWELTHDSSR